MLHARCHMLDEVPDSCSDWVVTEQVCGMASESFGPASSNSFIPALGVSGQSRKQVSAFLEEVFLLGGLEPGLPSSQSASLYNELPALCFICMPLRLLL